MPKYGSGSVTKRPCGCRDPKTKKQLGKHCPKANKKGHGSWRIQQELPPDDHGNRRMFRRGGYVLRDKAQADLDSVRSLLGLVDEKDDHNFRKMGDLLESIASSRAAIPDYDETKRRLKAGRALTSSMTVAEWLDEWLAGRKKLRKSGWKRYECDIRVHLKPRIGHILLDRLRVTHLDEMFEGIAQNNIEIVETNALRRAALDELKQTQGRKARQLKKAAIDAMPPFRRVTGPATQHHIRATLKVALNAAMRELITFNAATHVELEEAKRPKAVMWTDRWVQHWHETGEQPSPVMVWTPEQTGRFLDHIRTDHLYALFHLIAYRGLRRGEACGVRLADLDWKAAVLTVATQLVQDGWDVTEGEPKSDAGAREVALDTATLRVLRSQWVTRSQEKLQWGEGWIETGRLFTREDGSWIHPGWLSEYFERLVRRSGLPPVRLHDLRHGAATFALAAGIDVKIVSEMLGHSDSRVTRDIYQSVLPQVAHEAAEATANLIPRASARPSEHIRNTSGHPTLGELSTVSDERMKKSRSEGI